MNFHFDINLILRGNNKNTTIFGALSVAMVISLAMYYYYKRYNNDFMFFQKGDIYLYCIFCKKYHEVFFKL